MDEVLTDRENVPDGIARVESLDHAMAMYQPGEDEDAVLARAQKFYDFLTAKAGRLTWSGRA